LKQFKWLLSALTAEGLGQFLSLTTGGFLTSYRQTPVGNRHHREHRR